MANFQNLNIKSIYNCNSLESCNEMINDFYKPCLKKANSFDLISPYSSNEDLFFILRGLEIVLTNNINMRLILTINPQNLEKLIKTNKTTKFDANFIINQIINENNIQNQDFQSEFASVIAYIIKNNLIKIKFCKNLSENNNIHNFEEFWYNTQGTFKDSEKFIILFSGIICKKTVEIQTLLNHIFIYKNWKKKKKWKNPHLIYLEKNFEKLWTNDLLKLNVCPLSSIIEEEIQNLIPSIPTYENFLAHLVSFNQKLEKIYDNSRIISSKLQKRKIRDINLRKCQIEALNALKGNNYCGILSMATGSGKTISAIYASYLLLQKKKKILILIGVPKLYLVEQWYSKISRYDKNVIKLSSKYNWKKSVKNLLIDFELGIIDHYYLISTKDTIKSSIIDLIKNKKQILKKMLFIADEAHWMGEPTSVKLFQKFNPKYRIGLSATPLRQYDFQGTKFLLKWFKNSDNHPVIYEYSLKNGQNDGYLNYYRYHVNFCYLNEEEFKEYQDLSKKIRRISFIKNKDIDDNFSNLLIKRSLIVKNAISKIKLLKHILINLTIMHNKLYNMVIYGQTKSQLLKIEEILKNQNIKSDFFIGTTESDYRDKIINQLENKEIEVILAINCLNEGVDVPTLEKAIFVSCSSTEREWIQRTGRLLRRSPEKSLFADIYDLIVLEPNLKKHEMINLSNDSVFKIQRNRVKFLLNNSENKYSEIDHWENDFSIQINPEDI